MLFEISNAALTVSWSANVMRKVDYQPGQCLIKIHVVKVRIVRVRVEAPVAMVQVQAALVVKAKLKAANQVKATAAVEAILADRDVVTITRMDVNRVVENKVVVVAVEIRVDGEAVKLFC
ncbi:hypothetical protein D3C76_1391820 [compost metagenome]